MITFDRFKARLQARPKARLQARPKAQPAARLAARLQARLKPALNRFLTIFTLVSRIPVKLDFDLDYSRADFWLPLIGPFASSAALAGLTVGGLLFRDPLLSALAALFLQYASFNLFHLDGLLDSADAMLPLATPERRLEILKDSRIGAYAFFAGLIVFASKAAALARLSPGGVGSPFAVAALLAAPASGRAAAALVALLAPSARPGGLGVMLKNLDPKRLGLGLLLALLPLGLWSLASGELLLGFLTALAALGSALGAGSLVARVYKEKLRGFTGDALGAAVELGELFVLLLLAFLARTGWIW